MKGTFNRDQLLKIIKDVTNHQVPTFYCSGYHDVNHMVDTCKTHKLKAFLDFSAKHHECDTIYVFFDPRESMYTIQRSPFQRDSPYFNRLRIVNHKKHISLLKRFLTHPKKINKECLICFEELLLSDHNLNLYQAKLFSRVDTKFAINPFRVTCPRCQCTWCFKCNFKMVDQLENYCCPFCRMSFSEKAVQFWSQQSFRNQVHVCHNLLTRVT